MIILLQNTDEKIQLALMQIMHRFGIFSAPEIVLRPGRAPGSARGPAEEASLPSQTQTPLQCKGVEKGKWEKEEKEGRVRRRGKSRNEGSREELELGQVGPQLT